VRRLLARRKDVFPGYTTAGFESAFGAHFTIQQRVPVPGAARVLYRMRRKEKATA